MLRLLFFAWLVAGPVVFLLYTHSRDAVVEELLDAARRNSVEDMARRIDWPKTRGFMKEHLFAVKGALGPYGAAIGPPRDKVPEIVDHYMRPENIKTAYYFRDTLFPGVAEEDFIRDIGYESWLGFSVTVGYPENYNANPDITPVLKNHLKAKFVFRLDGLTWKVQELHLPVYMVPHRVYDMEEMMEFGDRYAP